MKNEKKKQLIIYIFAVVIYIIYVFVGNKIASTNTPELYNNADMRTIKAK